MRPVTLALLTLQCGLLSLVSAGDGDEHVHFKIYVPEIIKHHVHTNTVFIHVHDPKKKVSSPPKKNEHVESHHEDWNVWASHDDYNEQNDDRRDVGGQQHRLTVKTHTVNPSHNTATNHHRHRQFGNQGYVTPFDGLLTSSALPSRQPIDNVYREHSETPIPHYDDYRPNYHSIGDRHQHRGQPVKSLFGNGITGYSYPPQYAVEENVVEDVPDDSMENYKNLHEQGHSKRLHSETGHLYTNELTNFYDDKKEESHEALSLESKESDESNNRGYGYLGDVTRMMIVRQ